MYGYDCPDPSAGSTFHGEDEDYALRPPLLDIDVPSSLSVEFEGRIYDRTVIERSGVCQPGSKYLWGFSYQLTFEFLLVTSVLTLALYFLWILSGADHASELADTIFGSLRTALVVSQAMHETTGGECADMSNQELETAMRARRGGIVAERIKNTRNYEMGEPVRLKQGVIVRVRRCPTKEGWEETA